MPSWREREQSLSFDSSPIEEMYNLDGNLIAERYKQDFSRDQKYPLINFPSGLEREILLQGDDEQSEPHVHLFGRVSLPYQRNRDEAHSFVESIAEEHNLHVGKIGTEGLIITNPISTRSYALRYDNQERRIADIKHFPEHAMELMPGQIRAALPPLYAQEKKELKAIAPVKYFTPDAQWSWYPTEFDGEDIFFGLVSGFEIELGYFQLSDLESIRGGLRLPIERDLYYKPQSLEELQAYHRKQRGGY